jgi:hypothetical protein
VAALALGGCAQNLRPPSAKVYSVDDTDAFARLPA